MKSRCLIIANWAHGRTPSEMAASQHVSRLTFYQLAARFREFGDVGLIDRREENGNDKLTKEYLSQLQVVVASSHKDTAGSGRARGSWRP